MPIDVTQHIKIVYMKAHKLIPAGKAVGVTFDELVSAGFERLVLAGKAFNPDMGYKFSTYAGDSIHFSMLREINYTRHLVKYPRRAIEIAYKVESSVWAGDNEAVAVELGETVEMVAAANEVNRKLVALNAPLRMGNDSTNRTAMDMIATGIEDDYTRLDVEAFLATLPDRWQRVIRLRMEGKLQPEIALIVGISQPQVNRILKVRAGDKWTEWNQSKKG